MAETPEAKVKKKVRALLDKYGAYHFSYVVTGWGSGKGVPDIIACVNGKFFGIECKADSTKEPTALQIKNLERIHETGGVALVIHKDNLDYLESALKRATGVKIEDNNT